MEVPCFCAEQWSQECASGGRFQLAWCGNEDCKNDAARRRGHWVTGNTGGIACLECSQPYQTDGQLNKALAKTLNKGICADCKDAGVPEDPPEWYMAREKPQKKAKTTAATAWNADGWQKQDADEGKAEPAKWKRESWSSKEPWGSKDPWSKPSSPGQPPPGLGLDERVEALDVTTRRQEKSLAALAERLQVLEEKMAEQVERVEVPEGGAGSGGTVSTDGLTEVARAELASDGVVGFSATTATVS